MKEFDCEIRLRVRATDSKAAKALVEGIADQIAKANSDVTYAALGLVFYNPRAIE